MAGRYRDPTIYVAENGKLWRNTDGLNQPLTWGSVDEYVAWLAEAMVWDTEAEQAEWERTCEGMQASLAERRGQT